jgi:hypothetical protein
MYETMRDYLRRKDRLAVALIVIGLALVVLRMGATFMFSPQDLHSQVGLFTAARMLGLALILGGAALQSRLKCPKCNQPLGRRKRFASVPPSCPRCGVSFDEPLPQNPISPIS